MSTIANNVLLGRTADGARVFVTVETSRQAGAGRTVNHEPITSWTRVSFTGEIVEKYRREATSGGQIQDELGRIVTFASGWTRAKVATLVDLWDLYHLSDMQAGCAHQVARGVTTSERLDQTPLCAISGYKWGRSWLVLPEADTQGAIVRLRELFES